MTDEPRFETASASDQITSKITITDNRTPQAQLLARIAELEAQAASARDQGLEEAAFEVGCWVFVNVMPDASNKDCAAKIRDLKSHKGATL